MRPVAEQTVLVTGATDGLGRAVATRLAAEGATVLVHGRDERRGRETLERIAAETGSERLRLYLADLASLAEARRLAEAVLEQEERLDVLVNNAGIGGTLPGGARERRESADGHELRFAVNYLAPYLLTHRLLPLLERSAPARVVNVASAGQMPIDFADVMLRDGYSGRRAYCQSKLAQIIFTFDLAERLDPARVSVTALHPATFMPTKMVTEAGNDPISTLEEGTEATVRLAIDPALEGVTGRYFDRTRETRADEQAYDPEARRRLRELSDELTGLAPDA
jgi:NAD(P)-dependent dehydrogenase (short-subunit alcohol dehydrogenase family)